MTLRPLSIALLIFGLATTCGGQATLRVSRGWGGQSRLGRWNLITIRVSGSTPRNAQLEWIAPDLGGFATTIQLPVTINPAGADYQLFAPARFNSWDRSVLVLRDAQSRSLLAQWPRPPRTAAPEIADIGPQAIFVGTTGRPATLDHILRYVDARSAYLPPRLLPRAAIGYDSLDVLMLNQPDGREPLEREQDEAILNWVQGGGSLIFTPGDEALAAGDALLDALPCRIGPAVQVDINPESLTKAGLQPRFAHMAGHTLESIGSAQPLDLLPGVRGWSSRYGFGRILVLPIDVAALEFEASTERQAVPALWRPILDRLTGRPSAPPRRSKYAAPFQGYQSESEDQQREGAAIGTVCDFVSAPNTSGGYLLPRALLVLLCALFVVGPVDWIVLKALGERSLRPITAGGWLALIVVGVACVAASMFSGSSSVVRAIGVIDQIDGRSVAASGVAGLRSSRARQFVIELNPLLPTSAAAWWDAVAPGTPDPQAIRVQSDAAFHQTHEANTPGPLGVQPDLPRFLRSTDASSGPAMIEAALSLTPAAAASGAPRVRGTIKNVGPLALGDLHVRTRFGVIAIKADGGSLAPQGQVQIDVRAPGEPFAPQRFEGNYQNYGAYGSRSYSTNIRVEDLWCVAPDLAGRRSLRIDAMIDDATGAYACIYARVMPSPPLIKVHDNVGVDTAAYSWVRAVVALGR